MNVIILQNFQPFQNIMTRQFYRPLDLKSNSIQTMIVFQNNFRYRLTESQKLRWTHHISVLIVSLKSLLVWHFGEDTLQGILVGNDLNVQAGAHFFSNGKLKKWQKVLPSFLGLCIVKRKEITSNKCFPYFFWWSLWLFLLLLHPSPAIRLDEWWHPLFCIHCILMILDKIAWTREK